MRRLRSPIAATCSTPAGSSSPGQPQELRENASVEEAYLGLAVRDVTGCWPTPAPRRRSRSSTALSLGSIYALLAIGIAAVFAVLGLINFAHGEVLTLSGVRDAACAAKAGWPWETFIPIAILTGGVAAVLMERIAFRPVRNAPPVTLLLTSLGLSLIIQNALLLWRGPRPETINMPDFTNSTLQIGGVVVALARHRDDPDDARRAGRPQPVPAQVGPRAGDAGIVGGLHDDPA